MNDCNPNPSILIHMSYLNMDAVRVRQLFALCFSFFAFRELLAVWDDDIFLNEERGNPGIFFFPEHEKAKIPRFNRHLEDLSALSCEGARPGQ